MDGPKLKPAPPDAVISDEDDREPTKEELMEDIRQGLREILAGDLGRPAREVLAEIDRELMDDANAS